MKLPATEVEKEIMKQFCLDYGFGKYKDMNDSAVPRATEIYKLPSKKEKHSRRTQSCDL